MIRWAKEADKERIRQLWELCFSDSPPWTDWFFQTRFRSEQTVCWQEDGQIVSDMQLFPYPLRLRGQTVPALCVTGVATHPDYRGRGYMGKLFAYTMAWAAQKGYVCLFNMPQTVNLYEKYNHLYFTDRMTVQINSNKPVQDLGIELDPSADILPLLSCYREFMGKYSGPIDRTPDLQRLRIEDFFADGGKGLCIMKDGEVESYALYAEQPDKLEASEVIYHSQESLYAVIDALLAKSISGQIHLTLPGDAALWMSKYSCKIDLHPMNVLRILQPEKLLQLLGLPPALTLGLTDPFLPENNCVLALDGTVSQAIPEVSVDIGHFGQWISGYRTLGQLAAKGQASCGSQNIIGLADTILPAIPCYSLEAY